MLYAWQIVGAILSCHCDSNNNMAAVIAREIDHHERIPRAPYAFCMRSVKRVRQ